MRKVSVFIIALIAALLLTSCELTVTAPKKGTLHVVAIGNNFEKIQVGPVSMDRYVIYDGMKLGLSNISCCRNDANAVCQALYYWGKKSGMETDIVNLSDGFKSDFDTALDLLPERVDSDDLTVIYLSTHGYNTLKMKTDYSESVSDDSFFALEISANELECGYIKTSVLMDIANSLPGKVLILGDFCHSGSLVSQDNFTYNRANYTGSAALDLLFSDTPATDSNKVFVLSAATYFQSSYTGNPFGLPLSLFTWYLLRSLGMSNYNTTTGAVTISPDISVTRNKKIILSDIYRYVYKITTNSSVVGGHTQTPQINTGATDLILFSF